MIQNAKSAYLFSLGHITENIFVVRRNHLFLPRHQRSKKYWIAVQKTREKSCILRILLRRYFNGYCCSCFRDKICYWTICLMKFSYLFKIGAHCWSMYFEDSIFWYSAAWFADGQIGGKDLSSELCCWFGLFCRPSETISRINCINHIDGLKYRYGNVKNYREMFFLACTLTMVNSVLHSKTVFLSRIIKNIIRVYSWFLFMSHYIIN